MVSVPYNNKIIPIPSSCLLYHCCQPFHSHINTHKLMYIIYTWVYIIKYIIIILNKLLLDQLRIRKIKVFILSSLVLFLFFFSLCGTKFLTYIIFLLFNTFLNISCEADLLAINYLNLCLSEKVFISCLLWMTILQGTEV